MKTITPETIVVRVDNLLSTKLDDETILMSIEQGRYYGMEQTAQRIWGLVDKPHKVADLIAVLAVEYAVDPEVCGPDITEFLQELLQEQLIAVV